MVKSNHSYVYAFCGLVGWLYFKHLLWVKVPCSDRTLAVDWDVKHQFKIKKKEEKRKEKRQKENDKRDDIDFDIVNFPSVHIV